MDTRLQTRMNVAPQGLTWRTSTAMWAMLAPVLVLGILCVPFLPWLGVGIIGVVGLLGTIYHVRLRRLHAYAAEVNQTLDAAPPTAPSEGASISFHVRATQTLGARARDGFLICLPTATAFVPTSDWRHLAWEITKGVAGIVEIPISVAQLSQGLSHDATTKLVAAYDGTWLTEQARWSPQMGRQLTLVNGRTIYLLPDEPRLRQRWPGVDKRDLVARMRRGLIFAGTSSAVLIGIGALASHVTHNSGYLIAGSVYGLLMLIAAVLAWRATRRA